MAATQNDPIAALASSLLIPRADSRALVNLYAHHLVRVQGQFLEMRPRLRPSHRRAHELASVALQRAARENSRATATIFASPTVATPVQCLALRDSLPEFAERIDVAVESSIAHALLELAARGLLSPSTSAEVPASPILASPSLGVAFVAPPGTSQLRFERSTVVAQGASGALGAVQLEPEPTCDGFALRDLYVRVGRVSRLALVDHNPIAAFEAHPEKRGNPIDLGGRDRDEWVRALEGAFGVIERFLPEVFAEMRILLHEIVPVGYDEERHLSASYREAIGTVYLTLHPNTMTMAEALVHEFQHNKLNLASYATDFLLNAFEPRYPSPVRPDPRPLWGILLAAHAFLPVAVLYRRMRGSDHPLAARPDFERRLAEIDLKNHEAMEMLRRHARWTSAGDALMAELSSLDGAHMEERTSRGLPTAPTAAHLG